MNRALFIWDERKRTENLRKHGIDFTLIERFEFDTALITIDDRHDYGEVRYRAFGSIDGRLHALAFTLRSASVRVISLRRANARERRRYEEAENDDADE